MHFRIGTHYDLDLLAEWNRQLIQDEGHSNRMSVPGPRERMGGWLDKDYTAVIFEIDSAPVVYALFRQEPSSIYIRTWSWRTPTVGAQLAVRP